MQLWVEQTPPVTSILTDRALIAPLAGARNLSGYRSVYPHKWGYRAVIKWGGDETNGGRLRHWPTVHMPSQAAMMLAQWLRLRLGPRWAELVRTHKRNLWRKHAPFRARYSDRLEGWILTVWVAGHAEEVGTETRHKVFRSWADAADYVPEWMQARHGNDWWGQLWREASSPMGSHTPHYHPNAVRP